MAEKKKRGLFHKKEKSWIEKEVPVERVCGFAFLDLVKILKEHNWIIKKTKDIDWNVEYRDDDEMVIVDGSVRIPVTLAYEVGDLKNATIADDLKLAQVAIAGNKVYDAAEDGDKVKPLDTVNLAEAQVQAFRHAALK